MAAKKAVVLLSGGLDSATAAAVAKKRGYELIALSVDYGQRHRVELNAARAVARSLGVREHFIQKIDLRAWGGSALTSSIAVPKRRREIGSGIPVTYVPARNTIFLALALGLAEARGARDIFIGANVLDYSGYPDCRPEYMRAFERMARLGTKVGSERSGRPIKIHAPLIRLSKAQIIRKALRLGLDLSKTWSCYDPQRSGKRIVPCGLCDSCILRAKGFSEVRAVE